MFCATTNECDNDSKEWCFLPKKMSETNKNVTKMGVILKGVYYIDLRKFIVKN